jgi:hypothetical protein
MLGLRQRAHHTLVRRGNALDLQEKLNLSILTISAMRY